MGLALATFEPSELPSAPPALTVLPDPIAEIVTPAPAAAPAKGKLNLGKLGAKPAAGKAVTVHPTVAVPPEIGRKVEQFFEDKPRFDALKNNLEGVLRPAILEAVAPGVFEIPGAQYSVLVHGYREAEGVPDVNISTAKIMASFTDRYSGVDYDANWPRLVEIMGEPLTEELFTAGANIAIDLDQLPEERRQPLIDALLPIFEEHGAMDGEEPAVTVKQVLKPKALFHISRRSLLTPEQNLQVHAIFPCVSMLKVKNIRN